MKRYEVSIEGEPAFCGVWADNAEQAADEGTLEIMRQWGARGEAPVNVRLIATGEESGDVAARDLAFDGSGL